MPAALRLEAFGRRITEAFGERLYQVGSSVFGREWRDVDLRLMLPDDEFDALFPTHRTPPHDDPKWALLCDAISELARAQTGLPVDFQIQRTTEANAEFDGPRSALGLRIPPGK
jgi:hypothetical protein